MIKILSVSRKHFRLVSDICMDCTHGRDGKTFLQHSSEGNIHNFHQQQQSAGQQLMSGWMTAWPHSSHIAAAVATHHNLCRDMLLNLITPTIYQPVSQAVYGDDIINDHGGVCQLLCRIIGLLQWTSS